jgi:hypothetical protein
MLYIIHREFSTSVTVTLLHNTIPEEREQKALQLDDAPQLVRQVLVGE